MPARVVETSAGSAVSPMLELDLENLHLELWDDPAIQGAVVFQAGSPVGRVREVQLERAGLLRYLASGGMVHRTRVRLARFPDVQALFTSARIVGSTPSGWTELQESSSLRIGEPVWVLTAWGDVTRGQSAVVLGGDDATLAMGSIGGSGVHYPDAVCVVASVASPVRGAFGSPSPGDVGPYIGGVVKIGDGTWIATKDAMPNGIGVRVVSEGLGVERTECRYRVGRLGTRGYPLDGLLQALPACGIDQSHYYTPLRVEVVLDSNDPVELRAEASSLGSSAEDALRRVQRYLSDVRGGEPPQTIRITISPGE